MLCIQRISSSALFIRRLWWLPVRDASKEASSFSQREVKPFCSSSGRASLDGLLHHRQPLAATSWLRCRGTCNALFSNGRYEPSFLFPLSSFPCLFCLVSDLSTVLKFLFYLLKFFLNVVTFERFDLFLKSFVNQNGMVMNEGLEKFFELWAARFPGSLIPLIHTFSSTNLIVHIN